MKQIVLLVFILIVSACTSNDVNKVDVRESKVHFNLGIEFAQLNLFKNALEEFDLAIKFNPKNPEVYRKKGLVLFAMKRYDDAQENFEKTIKIDPH